MATRRCRSCDVSSHDLHFCLVTFLPRRFRGHLKSALLSMVRGASVVLTASSAVFPHVCLPDP